MADRHRGGRDKGDDFNEQWEESKRRAPKHPAVNDFERRTGKEVGEVKYRNGGEAPAEGTGKKKDEGCGKEAAQMVAAAVAGVVLVRRVASALRSR